MGMLLLPLHDTQFFRGDQSHLPSQELLHHPLLDLLHLITAAFEGGDPGIHIGEGIQQLLLEYQNQHNLAHVMLIQKVLF
jgi:hypothetical protein